MKKIVAFLMSVALLQACSSNSSVPATQDDGIKIGDTNGGLADTAWHTNQSPTDTSKGENREDLSKRDTFGRPPAKQ